MGCKIRLNVGRCIIVEIAFSDVNVGRCIIVEIAFSDVNVGRCTMVQIAFSDDLWLYVLILQLCSVKSTSVKEKYDARVSISENY